MNPYRIDEAENLRDAATTIIAIVGCLLVYGIAKWFGT